jgi:DNA end-binding protein Ku
MRESGELRSPKGLDVPRKAARAPEIKMARMLIGQMSGEFDPTEHPNVYRKALEKLLASKRRFELDTAPGEAAAPKKGAKVVDLMSALKRSLGDTGRTRSRGTRKRRAA